MGADYKQMRIHSKYSKTQDSQSADLYDTIYFALVYNYTIKIRMVIYINAPPLNDEYVLYLSVISRFRPVEKNDKQ